MKKKLFRGGIVVAFGGTVESALRLVRNMILARILIPEDFGVMAIILAFNAYFEAFTEVGIKQAIIQHPEGASRSYLNGAWWLSFGRGVILYTFAFVASPYISEFYNKPDLTPFLLRIAFLAIILNSTFSSNAFVTMKKMRFKRWVVLFHGGGIIGIVTAVLVAYKVPDVWALVIGLITEAGARTVLSYIVCPFLPGFYFKKEHFRSLLNFASGMFGIPFLFIVWQKTDVQVIGKLMTDKQLGYYAMAAALAREPVRFIIQVFNKIFLPAMSEVQNDDKKLNKIMSSSITGIIFLVCPLLFFAALFGADVLSLVYGKDYAVAAVPFAFIFAAEFLRISSVPITSAYLATGNPRLHRLFNLVRAIVALIVVYPLVKFYKLPGASFTVFISMFVGLNVQLYRIKLLTNFSVILYWTRLLKACIISCVVFIGWFIACHMIKAHSLITVAIGLLFCLLAYIIAYLTEPEIKKMIR